MLVFDEILASFLRKNSLFHQTGNLAKNRPTAQSSTGFGGVAARGVDGNRNPQWKGGSCTHTNRQRKPWWRVDLGTPQRVKRVKITNRGDCCAQRLRNVEIYVGTKANNPRTRGNQK